MFLGVNKNTTLCWDSLYRQILLNGKILWNKYCRYNEGTLYVFLSLTEDGIKFCQWRYLYITLK